MAAASAQAASISERLVEYGPAARARLTPHFQRAGVVYPPKELCFVGLKEERRLELYAASDTNALRFVHAYRILAASGGVGPKLREGDKQVPEGFYRIESLNPNSRYHLSLRINYPNQFDRKQARRDGRTQLGGDIMIHGSSVSIGCLAMGDEAAEDLFVLAADTGLKQIRVLLSPVDFRRRGLPKDAELLPSWVTVLHQQLATELKRLHR
jgi:murein L,D-transpeptidase YafK